MDPCRLHIFQGADGAGQFPLDRPLVPDFLRKVAHPQGGFIEDLQSFPFPFGKPVLGQFDPQFVHHF
jgi:hypothetical protein